MRMQSERRRLHQQALDAQEKGDFKKALILADKAMLTYQQDGDEIGSAEIHALKFLTLRHLFEKTKDKSFLILAEHEAMISVELAEISGQKEALAVPLFNLAKAYEAIGKYEIAIDTFQKALDNIINNPPETHNRPAVIADFKTFLATAKLRLGKKDALKESEDAISKLQKAEGASSYERAVWLSGAHMRIAECLRKDNPQKAKEHLQKAKEIIDSNPALKLRLGQWKKLAATFK